MDSIRDNLNLVKSILKDTQRYYQAAQLTEFDQTTLCPGKNREEAGDTVVALLSMIYRLRHEYAFQRAAEELYYDIDSLDEWDQRLVEMLHIERVRTSNYSATDKEENERAKNRAWINWVEARKKNDYSLFCTSFDAVRKSEMHRVSLWDYAEVKGLPLYDRMISEYEPGITREYLDQLFFECKKRLLPLLEYISQSKRQIRKDFLTRKVSDEQQDAMVRLLLDTIGFDMEKGMVAHSDHPFTEVISKNDIRLTVAYNPHNFLYTFFSVLHEAGHAILEQLQPEENYDYYLNEEKSRGMHESVARFYENIIGRSRAFLHLIYPKLCEIMPQVFFDVAEQEFYEAVNEVTPSPLRLDADPLTYIIHIMIRYEIERDLVDGELRVENVPKAWNDKYKKYLGVDPISDRNGCLQDITWTSYFGYFPTYALGDFYSAMYYNTMKEAFDVEEAIEHSDFNRINNWMRQNVFAKTVLLPPFEWIKDITGRPLTADDLLTHLEEKYDVLYDLSHILSSSGKRLYGYSRRMSRIRMLSSMQIDTIGTAEAYRAALSENFKNIGKLAEGNRSVVDDIINPMLENDDTLSEKTIQTIRTLNDSLLDIWTHDNVDLPMMSLLSERLMKDALKKDDDDYIVRQLDEEISACTSLILETRRIVTDLEITETIRRRGKEALDRILEYLDHDKFLKLSNENRELVMINSRYGVALYVSMAPLSREELDLRFELMNRSIAYADDPFYLDNLPNYDWQYHLYRIYQYISSFDEYNNVSGHDKIQLEFIADCGEKMEEMWLSDKQYFEQLDLYEEVHSHVLRNRMHAGRISKEEYRKELLKLYNARNARNYDVSSIINNLEIPREYIDTIDRNHLSEEDKMQINAMYNAAVSYVFSMPKLGAFYDLMDHYAPLLFNYMEIPGGLTFEEMGLKSFAAFHPPTYIHTLMVAQITLCLVSHLLRMGPDLFIGVMGCKTMDEVRMNSSEIENFAYHAALCHDFGKLIIIDTVFIYGRKILDFEFDIIRQHPDLGAMMLTNHPSTRDYVDIARGHHLWYDGSNGYPSNFDLSHHPFKAIIDVVTVADCMDAATDTIGRSYSKGKTLDEFIDEVKEGAGTRYSPYVAALLDDPDVYKDLECLLTERRQQAYLNTYNLLKGVQDLNTI